MVRKITQKGLRANLGRNAIVNYDSQKHSGCLVYSTYHESIALRTERGMCDIPVRNNRNISIDMQISGIDHLVRRTYKVSLK